MKLPARVALNVNAFRKRYEMLIYVCQVGDEWLRIPSRITQLLQVSSFLLSSNVFLYVTFTWTHWSYLLPSWKNKFPQMNNTILNCVKGILFPICRWLLLLWNYDVRPVWSPDEQSCWSDQIKPDLSFLHLVIFEYFKHTHLKLFAKDVRLYFQNKSFKIYFCQWYFNLKLIYKEIRNIRKYKESQHLPFFLQDFTYLINTLGVLILCMSGFILSLSCSYAVFYIKYIKSLHKISNNTVHLISLW